MQMVSYEDKYRDQVVALFEKFQQYLVEIDPLKRLRVVSGYSEKYTDKAIQEVKAKEGIFLLSLDEDRVAGFVVGIIDRIPTDDLLGVIPTSLPGRITELYIDPEYRGKGLATSLISKVEAYFRENGCDVSKVEVFVPNELAKNLYQHLGYEPRDIDNMKKL